MFESMNVASGAATTLKKQRSEPFQPVCRNIDQHARREYEHHAGQLLRVPVERRDDERAVDDVEDGVSHRERNQHEK
jgi:hypothetical protein